MDNPYYELLVNAAIRFVSFRPRSKKELTDYLNKKLTRWKQPDAGLLAKVIGRMEELGYADDEKFAEWWVAQRTEFKPKGNRYIHMELKAKGVPEAITASVLASRGSVSLLAAARQAVAKKMPLWVKLPVLARKKKIYDYLGRRGFDFEIIQKLIDERE
jgi:regulatory protein